MTLFVACSASKFEIGNVFGIIGNWLLMQEIITIFLPREKTDKAAHPS
jgi:hypothetical protein